MYDCYENFKIKLWLLKLETFHYKKKMSVKFNYIL